MRVSFDLDSETDTEAVNGLLATHQQKQRDRKLIALREATMASFQRWIEHLRSPVLLGRDRKNSSRKSALRPLSNSSASARASGLSVPFEASAVFKAAIFPAQLAYGFQQREERGVTSYRVAHIYRGAGAAHSTQRPSDRQYVAPVRVSSIVRLSADK